MKLSTHIRKIATQIIFEVIHQKKSLAQIIPEKNLNVKERSAILELVYGTLRYYYRLKLIADHLLLKPLKPNQQIIFCLLLVGLYQLNFMNITEYAAVSETVETAKALKKMWAVGLINKLLRRFIQEKDQLLKISEQTLEGLYAHPTWLINRIKTDWPNHWQEVLAANNYQGPMTLRVNRLKTTVDNYLKQLTEKNITAEILSSTAIQLKKAVNVHDLPGFYEGFCSVQDLSGQHAARLLDLIEGQRVLDACAAPGSKTSHILETQPNLAHLTCIDQDPLRIQKIKQNIERLQLDHQMVYLVLADAAAVKQWWNAELFDRILLDAPCSATGVIRRHPDIKLLRLPGDITNLAKTQGHLLNALWPLLKVHGKLLYSTCSILSEENEHQIKHFIQQHKNAKTLPLTMENSIKLNYGYQLLPTTNGHDGFYYALLEKT